MGEGLNEQKQIDFEKLVKYRNDHNAFAQLIAIQVDEIHGGYARAHFDVTEKHMNPINSVHGGCLYSLADVVAGSAASSYGMKVTTMDSNMQYLRPAIDCTQIIGYAEAVKVGKRVAVYRIELRNQDETVLAIGTFTFMSLGVPLELE